jgi:ribosomal protein L37AE/L43A
MTAAPGNSQGTLRTLTQWRYCNSCSRSTPQVKVAGDNVWQCPWCGKHQPDSVVQTSAEVTSGK